MSGSIVKDDNRYSPDGAIAGGHLNEPEGIAFALSKDFTQGLTPREGTSCTLKNSIRVTVGWPLQVRMHEPNSVDIGPGVAEICAYLYTDRQLSFIYILGSMARPSYGQDTVV